MANKPSIQAINGEPRPGDGAIIVMLCLVPFFATVAYGAVDLSVQAVVILMLAVVSLMWIVQSWRQGEFVFNASALLLPLGGWILLAMIQLLPLGGADATGVLSVPAVKALSLDPFQTRLFLVRLILYTVFFGAALTFINSAARQRRIAMVIIFLGSVMAFFGILQRLAESEGIYGLRETPHAIPFASFVNQHHFAALMEMTVGLSFGILAGGSIKRDRAPLLIICTGVMAIAMMLTGSRGGILGLITVVVLILLINLVIQRRTNEGKSAGARTGMQRRLAIIAAGTATIVVIAGVILFLGGSDSLTRIVGMRLGETDFTSGRGQFWSTAWQIFLSNPLLGAGFDAFGVAYTRFDTMNGIFRVEQAHNEYLQTLADAGVLGLICLILFVYFLFRIGLAVITESSDKYDRSIAVGALAGCAGILTHSFFDFPLRTPANAFFFLLLVTLATNEVSVRKRRKLE